MPADEHELTQYQHRPVDMEEEEEAEGRSSSELLRDDIHDGSDDDTRNDDLSRRVRRKLDFILLPFLALLFLLNSLDKSNIGNAETAGFTHDAGLSPSDLNTALACFFGFFVLLQPVGAALGRKYGMARWVPACMTLWGACTILHIWVRSKWQLVVLRIAIASLEAGFYPTTVSYISLFYTRYEFAVRLGVFYGQTAVAGVLGGILSWGIFRRFESGPDDPTPPPPGLRRAPGESNGWRSWEVLFLIEGCMTMVVALWGFLWLPHSADTAWFLDARERRWAEERIRLDRDENTVSGTNSRILQSREDEEEDLSEELQRESTTTDDLDPEAHHGLLSHTRPIRKMKSNLSTVSVTNDSGLSRHDIVAAVLNYKIWHLLVCNILSAIPATAFGVFLPLVIKQLSPSLNLTPAQSNLLSAPPFAFGAVVLFIFTRWSDKSEQRLVPILWGLGVLLIGLLLTVMTPMSMYVLRYISLCILLSGSFVASPLTVAWLANNTPETGKRAILLGINGWGNLAGVFSALLFTPDDEASGYIRPFAVTLGCVVVSFAGFIAFWIMIVRINTWREIVVESWSEAERDREEMFGDVSLPATGSEKLKEALGVTGLKRRLGLDGRRKGDERLTFRFGM